MTNRTLPEPERILVRQSSRGSVEILPSAVAEVAGHAALTCYGVRSMAARSLQAGVAQLLRREHLHRGIVSREMGGGLEIDVYVVVNYGVRIIEVAHNVQSAVKFQIERTFDTPVAAVNVYVQGVQGDS